MDVNTILQGDTLTILKTLPDAFVDITITSPPYNLGSDHHLSTVKGRRNLNPYDDNLPEQEYQSQQIEVLNELYRITKPTGSIIYNHKNRIRNGRTITPYEWILKTNWVLKQELVWFNRSQNFDKIRFYPMTERLYWLAKDPKTKLHNAISHHDLFDWKPVGTSAAHTRAFPEAMVSDLLQCFPNSQLVLDPYMGSGTTAVVARNMDKDYLGIELNPDYIDIARKRLEIEQLSLM